MRHSRLTTFALLALPLAMAACSSPGPRDTCLVVSGANLSGGTRRILSGEPASGLDPGANCIEGGRATLRQGVVTVKLDNPRIWTEAELGSARSKRGVVKKEFASDFNGWSCANCSFDVQISGGEIAAGVGNIPAAHGSSVNDLMPPWTSDSGHWGPPNPPRFSLLTQGLRVGYRPMDVQLWTTQPSNQREIAAFPARVILDPNVILIPIQVLVLFSEQHLQQKARLGQQLALWDRVATVSGRANLTEGGELTSANRQLAPWMRGGESAHEAFVSLWGIPDDIWAPCDIQFRLVAYEERAVPDSITMSAGTFTSQEDALDLNVLPILDSIPSLDPALPTMIFMEHCIPRSINGAGGLGEVGGVTFPHRPLACVSTGIDEALTPAHELGHILLKGIGHPPCDTDETRTLVMCAAPGGESVSAEECSTIRAKMPAAWSEFYPHPLRDVKRAQQYTTIFGDS